MTVSCYRLILGEHSILPQRVIIIDKNSAVCMARYAEGFYDEVRLEFGDYDSESGSFEVVKEVRF